MCMSLQLHLIPQGLLPQSSLGKRYWGIISGFVQGLLKVLCDNRDKTPLSPFGREAGL